MYHAWRQAQALEGAAEESPIARPQAAIALNPRPSPGGCSACPRSSCRADAAHALPHQGAGFGLGRRDGSRTLTGNPDGADVRLYVHPPLRAPRNLDDSSAGRP
jgi:hypothetical protein